jgi:Flp pilus assembly protein TadD
MGWHPAPAGGMRGSGVRGPGPGAPARYDNAARLRTATAAEASGQTNVALSMLASAAAAAPSDAALQSRHAAALLRAGDVARAEEVLTQALRRNPDAAPLLGELGRLRLRAGAAQEAITLFDRVLVQEPRLASALSGRAIGFDLLGQHAGALAGHQAAFAGSPEDMGITNNLAVSLMLAGRFEEAEALLPPLSRRSGAPLQVTLNLAMVRLVRGDRDGAEALVSGGVVADRLLPWADALKVP